MKKTLTLAALASAVVLTGCSVGASPDQIGIVRGSGQGTDAKVRQIIYPGQEATTSGNTVISWIPGGSRNYVISSNTSLNPDRTNPSTGRTDDGTDVNVELRASWMVNQDEETLVHRFVPFCGKYGCDSANPAEEVVDGRSSTQGWVDMLDAEMSSAIDASVRRATPQFDDSIWEAQEGWDDLASAIAEEFPRQMRANTGFTEDLFCGSGDMSFWEGEPGADGATFTCGPVLFQVTKVTSSDQRQQQAVSEGRAAEQLVDTNAKQREAAEAKYGQGAGEYLGQLDLIEACQKAGASCTVVIGGNGSSVVPVPVGGQAGDEADGQE